MIGRGHREQGRLPGIADPRQGRIVAIVNLPFDPGIELDSPFERPRIAIHEHRHALSQIMYDVAAAHYQHAPIAQRPKGAGKIEMEIDLA